MLLVHLLNTIHIACVVTTTCYNMVIQGSASNQRVTQSNCSSVVKVTTLVQGDNSKTVISQLKTK